MKTRRYPILFLIAVALISSGCATTLSGIKADPQQRVDDPSMGDWEGQWETRPLFAQVIAQGKGTYQANILGKFDSRDPALAVLKGKLRDGAIEFQGAGTGELEGANLTALLRGKSFSGKVTGSKSGNFELKKVTRVSRTLGKRPPRDAIVLFNGRNLNAWKKREINAWGINLKKAVGGDQRVVYMRTWVLAPSEQVVQLGVGSADGVKVWLNDTQVLAVDGSSKVVPGEHKINVPLKEGWNLFLVKVAQNDKDWGLSAWLRNKDESPLEGFWVSTDLSGPEHEKYGNPASLAAFDGNLAMWEVTEAYTKDGKDGNALYHIAFPPELGQAAKWRLAAIPTRRGDQPAEWKLLPGGVMEVAKGSIMTKRKFRDHELHVEFRTPFMPEETGQKRGNSGVFLQNRYEVQVLDSYGLSGENNECGGIYKNAVPRVNMCAPPLQWQTYDIIFRAARYDENWKKIDDARATVYHNGVKVHENQAVPDKTTGSMTTGLSEPDSLSLQDHGNPIQFRNIWLVELDDGK
jgi:3-keto-disaccharide hydrolase